MKAAVLNKLNGSFDVEDIQIDLPREREVDDLISNEINISQINDAYAELKNGAIARSVITSF